MSVQIEQLARGEMLAAAQQSSARSLSLTRPDAHLDDRNNRCRRSGVRRVGFGDMAFEVSAR